MHSVPLQRTSITGRAALDGGTVHHADVVPLLEHEYPAARANAQETGFRAVLAVPLVRDGTAYGAIFLWRRVPGLFAPDQVTLVETFARQAAITIANVDQARATQEALEQQRATSEILGVISRSPTDVQPVFDAIAHNASRLCAAPFCHVFRFDGALLHFVSSHGLSEAGEAAIRAAYPMAPGRGSAVARAVQSGRVEEITDVHADPDYRHGSFAQIVTFRSVVAVPILRNGIPLGAIAMSQAKTGRFPERQIALLRTFADQAVIAIENVRLFTELEHRNRDLSEALDQQTATTDVLRAISRTTFDLSAVLQTLVESAARLCDAESGTITRQMDGLFYRAEAYGYSHEFADYVRDVPVGPERGSATGRALLERRVVHIPDVRQDAEYTFVEAQRLGAFRTVLAVPMLREGEPIGALALTRSEVRPFTDRQIALVSSFADQAVIAIENVRLFTELEARNRAVTEALEQQTATSEILRVISRSPTSVDPVFATIAQAALRLCSAASAVVATYDGTLMHIGALASTTPEGADAIRAIFPRPAGRDNGITRAVLTRATVMIPDVRADHEYTTTEPAIAAGFRSVLAVPLVHDGRTIGAISLGRAEPGPYSDAHVALLSTFADQAVIAIENVRLFTELGARNRDLSVALEQQTATSEILHVISRSRSDTQPVFATIVKSVRRLCDTAFSGVYLLDGDTIGLAAADGMTPEAAAMFAEGYPRRVGADTVSGRAALECRVVQTPDLGADPQYREAPGTRVGARTVLAVPLRRDGRAIGSIGVWRSDVRPFTEAQIALLATFADQAVIAIENVRLFNALQGRNRDLTEALEQQTATSEILRVISRSQTDVQPVFDTIARAARELCGASSGNVFTYDGRLVHLASIVSSDPSYVERLHNFFPQPLGRKTAVLRAIQTGRVVAIPDVHDDADYDESLGAHSVSGGFRSVLSVPLLREGSAIGGVAVGRQEPGPFTDTQVALLQTFADQAVIAIENVRLFNELQARTADLTRSVGELKALGEVGQAVSSTLDLETVLHTIVTRATQLTGMDGGSIYEYDEAREEFHLHTADRLPDELVDALRATPMRKGEGALGRMALTGEPVAIRDIGDEAAYQSRVRSLLVSLGFRSLLAVPLVRDNHILGGLAVNRKAPGEFAPAVVALLQTFAAQSALAIQNARLFRELEVKSRELETASRHKSEFLANMSHELRTPLNAIIGFSEVLAERLFGDVNDKQAEYLGDILASGRHLLALINDILDLSKIEAGRMELERSEFDLPAAIGNTLSLVRERAQRRNIALAAEIDPAVGAIGGDERKVKQVLLNLLSNALKFTPEAGTVSVRARRAGGMVEVAVSDTGVGIAPEDQAAVFEEFRQVGAASRKAEGTGLGLAISRKFVELHGGTIRVDSAVGKGSTFTFTLPV